MVAEISKKIDVEWMPELIEMPKITSSPNMERLMTKHPQKILKKFEKNQFLTIIQFTGVVN